MSGTQNFELRAGSTVADLLIALKGKNGTADEEGEPEDTFLLPSSFAQVELGPTSSVFIPGTEDALHKDLVLDRETHKSLFVLESERKARASLLAARGSCNPKRAVDRHHCRMLEVASPFGPTSGLERDNEKRCDADERCFWASSGSRVLSKMVNRFNWNGVDAHVMWQNGHFELSDTGFDLSEVPEVRNFELSDAFFPAEIVSIREVEEKMTHRNSEDEFERLSEDEFRVLERDSGLRPLQDERALHRMWNLGMDSVNLAHVEFARDDPSLAKHIVDEHQGFPAGKQGFPHPGDNIPHVIPYAALAPMPVEGKARSVKSFAIGDAVLARFPYQLVSEGDGSIYTPIAAHVVSERAVQGRGRFGTLGKQLRSGEKQITLKHLPTLGYYFARVVSIDEEQNRLGLDFANKMLVRTVAKNLDSREGGVEDLKDVVAFENRSFPAYVLGLKRNVSGISVGVEHIEAYHGNDTLVAHDFAVWEEALTARWIQREQVRPWHKLAYLTGVTVPTFWRMVVFLSICLFEQQLHDTTWLFSLLLVNVVVQRVIFGVGIGEQVGSDFEEKWAHYCEFNDATFDRLFAWFLG